VNDIINAINLTQRDIIESVVSDFYILDYGYVSKVNGDNTVNVIHARKQVLKDGTVLKETETKNIEVLFLSSSDFSMKWKITTGDTMLLLGLKDYVKSTQDVSPATALDVFTHYSRSTIKALPLRSYNEDSKVKIEVENGKLSLMTNDDLTVKVGSSATVTVGKDGSITIKGNVKVTGGQFECGGTVTPQGSGALCAIPYCPFTGAPQCGSTSSGT
jgi:hypothetical protein